MIIRFNSIVIVIALMQSCRNPVETDFDYLTRIRIKSDTTIPFADSSRIKINLYAYDERVMDAPATNLKTIETLISSLNVEYILKFNRNDFGSVQPGSGRGEYRYYFSYTIDLNHDGQICISDYIQDFDKSPFINYTHTESGERIIDLYTKKVTEGNCYAF